MVFKLDIQKIALAVIAVSLSACASAPDRPATESGSAGVSPNSETASTQSEQEMKFPATLSLCPRMTVSNAPASANDRQVLNYRAVVAVKGTRLAVAPVEHACLSSGFGVRGERMHKGIDLYNRNAVKIYAASNGRVKEKLYRDDYGNMLVIEHGNGVFARYAHLESFASGLIVGDQVTAGQTIGIMGNTASYQIPRHLHYEVLTGDWGALSGAFGLTPVDLFAQLPGN